MTVIRKYGNRRLYDTERSAYVNLDQLAGMIRRGEEVRVEDAKTGEDLTREVLLQVVLEVQGGLDFLPVGLLRRVIRATGEGAGQALLRQQLATAFAMIHDQLDRMEAQFGFFNPAPRPAPGPRAPASAEPAPDEEPPEAEPVPPPRGAGEDLATLRARLEALERRLRKDP